MEPNVKVLIVDDDQQIRSMLDSFLAKIGWVVEIASDPDEAESLLDDSFDVVLSDVRMGGRSGVDLMRRIRDRFPALEVILMSGCDEPGESVESLEPQPFGYLRKPFDITELNRMLIKAMRARDAKLLCRSAADQGGGDGPGPQREIARRGIVLAETLSSVAHELNQPLNAFAAYVQLMAFRLDSGRGVNALEQKDMCRDMLGEIERMSLIIGRIRDFVRVGRGRARRQVVDIRRLYLESTSAAQASILENGIRLEEDFPAGLGSFATDPERLGMIFVELLLNARDSVLRAHGAGGGGVIGVSVEASTQGGLPGVAIRVRDNGTGLKPEHLDRIFDPFFSADPGGSGAGLGLTVVSGIVRNLSGAIEVESGHGAGAAFRVWLPEVENNRTSGAER